jgi:hypothetical protein
MTDEMLKKLSRIAQDTDQTINFPDFSAVLVSCEFKFTPELNPSHSETDSRYRSFIDNILLEN